MDLLGTAQATTIFIVANLVLSITAFMSPQFMQWGILSTSGVFRHKEFHRILIAGFLHADPMHLLFNMLTLYFFGPYLEYVLGSQSFFLIFLGSLIFGNLAALMMHAKNPNYLALGASGAVSGIVFTYCLLEPFSQLRIFFAIPVPALLFAVLYVAYTIYGMRAQNDNIGHDAHLAGAVSGVLITILLHPNVISHFLSNFG